MNLGRVLHLPLFAVAALSVMLQAADARDGCGPGYYYDGYRCRPMDRDHGPGSGFGYDRHYEEPYYRDRGYGPPGEWRAIPGESSSGRPEIWYEPRGGSCPNGFTVQDGVCKKYRGR